MNLIISSLSLENIKATFISNYLSFSISLSLFFCFLLLIRVFFKYRFITFKILFTWILSGFIVLFFLQDNNDENVILAINSQLILIFVSSLIMILFYIFGFIFPKKSRPKKNFGRNFWWVWIISFIVIFAFSFMFNIFLYISTIIFFL